MLAYILWHTPQPDVPTADYEAHLAAFQESLQSRGSPGFLRAQVFRAPGLPWLDSPREIYEDWYRLEDSAAMDHLNEAAVDTHRKMAHDQVAALAGPAAAGLLRHRGGGLDLHARRTWFTKPQGMTYAELGDRSAAWCGDRGGVWGRQMVLGPSPEFCVMDPTVELPPEYTPFTSETVEIWRSG